MFAGRTADVCRPLQLAAYDRAAQLRSEDKSGKWIEKVKRYKELIAQNDPAYTPDTKYDGLIEILFPEIFEQQ